MAFSFPSGGVLHASDLNTYLQDSGWQAIAGSYGSGWADYGNGWEVGRYRKIGRIVYLGGMVLATSATTANVDSTIFTLATGYRPTAKTSGSVALASPASGGVVGRISITTGGAMVWNSSTALPSNTPLAINGFFFID